MTSSQPTDSLRSVIRSIYPLLVGSVALGMGSGLLFTLIGVRLATQEVAARTIGVLGSGFFAGFLAGALVARRVVQRIGHVRAFVAFTAISAMAAAAHVLVESLLMWGALRVLMGFCLAGAFVVSESWIQFKTTNAMRGRTFAIYAIASSGGFATGPLLINVMDPLSDGLFLIATMLFLLAFLPVALSRVDSPEMPTLHRVSMRNLVQTVPIAVIGVFAAGLILSSYAAVGPVYAKELGMTAAYISLFIAAMSFGGIIMQYPVGSLSDRFGRLPLMIVLGFGATAVAVVTMAMGSASAIALVGMSFLHGAACQPIYGLSVAHANDVVGAERFVGTSAGLLFVNGIGTSLGPIAAAAVMDWRGPSGLFLFFGVVLGGFAAFVTLACCSYGFGERGRRGFVSVPLIACACASPFLDPRSADESQ